MVNTGKDDLRRSWIWAVPPRWPWWAVSLLGGVFILFNAVIFWAVLGTHPGQSFPDGYNAWLLGLFVVGTGLTIAGLGLGRRDSWGRRGAKTS